MYQLKQLNNGLRIITAPMAGTKTVTILVVVGTGSKYETRSNNGISHFLEHMFFKGTKKRPTALAIASELDKVGGEYNAFTGKEYTGYWVKVAAGELELALEVVSDMLLNPKLDSREIAREKGVIIEEINLYRDNPLMYIEDIFEACLYGDQPAGWDTIGTKDNILKMRRADFLSYLKSQYGSQSAVICLAGNLAAAGSVQGCRRLAEKYFSALHQTDFQAKPSVRERQTKPRVKLHYKKTDQVHLSLGLRAFPAGHPDEQPLRALAVLLGGSMSSRLFISLRERQGLAYYVRTQNEFYTDSGYLTTQAGVPIDKIEQALNIILAEYSKLTSALVNQQELNKVKQTIAGRIALQLEASDNLANWYAKQAVLNQEIIAPEELIKRINKLTAAELKRVSQEIFTNVRLNLALIGPFRDQKRFEGMVKF